MKIKIYKFGKTKDENLKNLEKYYFSIALRFWNLEIVVLKDIADRKISISDLPKNFDITKTILLSEYGKEYFSHEFAQFLNKHKEGSEDISFLIANAFGFDEEISNLSKSRISLSKMTFPHEMAEVMILEQVFRAGDILRGGKYSK